MKVSVFGLGYVGAVTAACFSRDGHHVTGVDVNPEKVARIARGDSPIVEPQLGELLLEGVQVGRITATTDAEAAVMGSDASMISVGTPPGLHGRPNLDYVFGVCEQIGRAIQAKGEPHTVLVRSTVPPGTLTRCRVILEEAAGEVQVHVAFNPEFLREGSAVADYYNPPYTIIGTHDPVAEADVRALYSKVDAEVHVVEPEVAEMVKYVANTWHATKIAFANEIGRVAKPFGVDGRQVMNLITKDTKLNTSAAYMRPGFAYGGSCLPKDLGSLLYFARENNVPTPLLSSVPASNELMIDLAVKSALSTGARKVAVLGLAFKPGTDDLRESPAVELCKKLLGEGIEIRVFDPSVTEAWLMGANLEYIQANLPHFQGILARDASEALHGADLAIVTYGTAEFKTALEQQLEPGAGVLDLAGLLNEKPEGRTYHALGW